MLLHEGVVCKSVLMVFVGLGFFVFVVISDVCCIFETFVELMLWRSEIARLSFVLGILGCVKGVLISS